MGTLTGIAIGVAFATPITAMITTVLEQMTTKLSDPELYESIATTVSNKTSELAPKVIDQGVEKAPRLIDMLFG